MLCCPGWEVGWRDKEEAESDGGKGRVERGEKARTGGRIEGKACAGRSGGGGCVGKGEEGRKTTVA